MIPHIVRKVLSVAATVSCQLHIQFMSIWAWPVRIS